jgi:hypothetical protein
MIGAPFTGPKYESVPMRRLPSICSVTAPSASTRESRPIRRSQIVYVPASSRSVAPFITRTRP